MLEELAASNGALLRSYLLGHDVIAQDDSTNGFIYLIYDGHGSTRMLVDNVGVTLRRDNDNNSNTPDSPQIFTYTAYGELIEDDVFLTLTAADDALTVLLYSGEWVEATTGWQYNRERFYNPSTGRWNRMDDFAGNIRDPLSLHKYLYTHGDPVNGIDPSGLFTLSGLGVSMSNMTSRFGNQASASFNALRATNDVRAVIQTFTQIVRGLDNLFDTVNAVRDAIDLLNIDASDLAELASNLSGKLINGASVRLPTLELNLPAGINRKFRGILGRFLGVPLVQQWIGEITAALVAEAVGFESTDLAMQRTGFDAVMWHPAARKFLALEAKGGSGTLKGGQMRKACVDRARDDVVNDVRNISSSFRRDFEKTRTMWAMVVKIDVLGSPQLAVKVQNYPWIRRWGSPFENF